MLIGVSKGILEGDIEEDKRVMYIISHLVNKK